MPDARPGHGTPIDVGKLRSLQVMGTRRPRFVEGKAHPETGVAYKTTITDAGTTTEHNTKDDRVDATARPETVTVIRKA